MNIAIFHSSFSKTDIPSGEKVVAQLDKESLQDISSVYYYGAEELIGERKNYPIISIFRLFFSFKIFRNVREIINNKSISVIHIHGIFPHIGPTIFLAAKSKKVKVVQTLHNARWFCIEGGLSRRGRYCDKCIRKTSFWGVIYGCTQESRLKSLVMFLFNCVYVKTGLIFKLVDQFVAVSDFVRDQHIKVGFPPGKIIRKYNSLHCLNKSDLVPYDKRKGVVYSGRISWAKGAQVLLYLIEHYKEEIYIVGDGPELQTLKDFAKKDQANHVSFYGSISRENAQEIVKKSKCLILPSQCGESFSTSAIEAMSFSVPVISSSVGGMVETFEKSGGGILVSPENFQGFQESIEKIFEDSELERQLGEAGYKFVEKELNFSDNGAKLSNIYKSL